MLYIAVKLIKNNAVFLSEKLLNKEFETVKLGSKISYTEKKEYLESFLR